MKDKDFQPVSRAAEMTGVHRVTLSRWISAKKLKTRRGPLVRNLSTTLISIKAIRKIAAGGVKPGRPKGKVEK
jgi:hypothetical protein